MAGLDVRIKKEDSETGRGTKTAWMGCYWDSEGVEKELTGYTLYLPDGTEVPQVSQYTHLGVSLQAAWPGRHDEARERILKQCKQVIHQIGKVRWLGPEQVKRATDMAVGGIIGYTGRSTPIDWATCNKIEASRVEMLRRAGLAGGKRRAPVYMPAEAGGMEHTHAYQIAAASYVDQFERAINAGVHEPAHQAVTAALELKAKELGYTGDPYS